MNITKILFQLFLLVAIGIAIVSGDGGTKKTNEVCAEHKECAGEGKCVSTLNCS